MTFEEWCLSRESLPPTNKLKDVARLAWEAGWAEGLAEGYDAGYQDNGLCPKCLGDNNASN